MLGEGATNRTIQYAGFEPGLLHGRASPGAGQRGTAAWDATACSDDACARPDVAAGMGPECRVSLCHDMAEPCAFTNMQMTN